MYHQGDDKFNYLIKDIVLDCLLTNRAMGKIRNIGKQNQQKFENSNIEKWFK